MVCKTCGHPKTIHQHYLSSGLLIARNTPKGRRAIVDQVKRDTVVSWCAVKGCSCMQYKVTLRNRIKRILAELRLYA